MASMRLGTVIRHWRKQADVSLKDAASEMGISLATLSRLETGSPATDRKPDSRSNGVDGTTIAKVLNWLLSDSNGKATGAGTGHAKTK